MVRLPGRLSRAAGGGREGSSETFGALWGDPGQVKKTHDKACGVELVSFCSEMFCICALIDCFERGVNEGLVYVDGWVLEMLTCHWFDSLC